MIKMICDACGREIKTMIVSSPSEFRATFWGNAVGTIIADLCEKCKEELHEIIVEWMESKGEKQNDE